jgi:hypothetical protein
MVYFWLYEELERIDKIFINTFQMTLLKNASLYIGTNIIHIELKVSLGGTTKNITPSFYWTTLISKIIFDFIVQYLINLFIVFHYPNCGFLNGPHLSTHVLVSLNIFYINIFRKTTNLKNEHMNYLGILNELL